MDFQLDSVIEVLLSNDNLRRIEAEKYVDEIPLNNFEAGIDAFMNSMAHSNPNVFNNLSRSLQWVPYS